MQTLGGGKKVSAERSGGCWDLLPGCSSGEAEENDVTKQAACQA